MTPEPTGTPTDHEAIARHLQDLSEILFESGNGILGAEALWGAASHAVSAAAASHNMRSSRYRHKLEAISALSRIYGAGDELAEGFARAQSRLHVHFYQAHLTERQLTSDRRAVSDLVARALAIAETQPSP